MSLKRATLVSLALHLCAAALLALLPRSPYSGDRSPTEAVRTVRITIAARSARDVLRHNAATVVPRFTTTAKPQALIVAARDKASSTPRAIARESHARTLQQRLPTVVAHANDMPRAESSEEPPQTKASAMPTATNAPAAVPIVIVASPTPSPAPTQAVAESNVPPGGWGQSFAKPLVADDDALANLRASLHTAATVTIDVDDRGHAIRVKMPASISGDERSDIEKRLLAMQYVPAECNGLRCTGTLTLTF